MAAIGVPTPRRDSEPKVRGQTRFAADVPIPGLLHARLVLSHEAHALIRSIESDLAAQIPGVVAILTAADLPIVSAGTGRMYEPLAKTEVLYAGQPVAMVIGETEAAAEDGAELVSLELDPLPPVLDLEAAIRPDAPLAKTRTDAPEDEEGADLTDAHASVTAETIAQEYSANVRATARLPHGDADAELAASHVTVKGRFATPWVYQGYLEPQAATAWLEPHGELVLSTATQAPFATRDSLAGLFGLETEQVRVRGTTLGGSFGGKIMIIDPLVAAAALRLRRPVRLAMTRGEDQAATNPAGAQIIDLEIGATVDGTLTAVRANVLVDRGSTEDYGVESIAAMLTAGPYRWRAHDLRALGVATSRMTFGAYRAPTAPPAAFALESLIDELAGQLGMDPLELRLRNVAEEGDRSPAGRPFPVFGAKACLEALESHPLYAARNALPPNEGVGIALGWWPGGYEPAAALCRLDKDGRLTIVTGAADMTGVESGFAAIAAEAFGVDPARVRVVTADTASAPYAGTAGGSKITYTVGRAVQRAALQARERLLAIAADELEIAPEDLEIVDGTVQPTGVPAKAIAIDALADKILRFGSPHPPVEGHGRVANSQAPQAAAHLAHVRVDPETGAVTPLRHVVAQDVGRALNPALVAGQMMGGAAQGLGWALLEELVHDEHGQLSTGTLVDYALPTSGFTPAIETLIVEVPVPDGPYGAKGVGEAPVVAAPAAVANAVASATGGVRLRRLPMTPERVWAALAAPATSSYAEGSSPPAST